MEASLASPHFLGVVVAERIISNEQATRIAARQASYRSMGVTPCPRVGEIAIDLGCLSESNRDKGLELLKNYRGANRMCRDPISILLRDGESARSVSGGAALGGLILAWTIGTWLATRSWEITAIAATLVTTVVGALAQIAPSIVNGRILWHRYVRTVVAVAVAMAYAFGIWSIRSLSLGMILSFNALALGVIYFGAKAYLRRWELRSFDARQYLTRALIRPWTAGVRSGPLTRDGQTTRINTLLSGAVQLLSLNVYGRITARLVRWKNPSASMISVWYLRRMPEASKLKICAYACSTTSREIVEVFDKISAKHEPSALNQERFDEVWAECQRRARAEVGDNRRHVLKRALKLFRDQVERPKFVSLAGWVLGTGHRIFANDLDKCMVFEQGYFDVLDGSLTEEIGQALRFGSAIAYPVGSDGVLMALRPIKNGFISEDAESIFEIAQSLTEAMGSELMEVERG